MLIPNVAPLQISDFGMSRDLQDEDYYTSNGGKIPIKWTAPEVCESYIWSNSMLTLVPFRHQALHYRTYSTASDVWSFGCVMYEIWSLGSKPFEGKSNQEVGGGWSGEGHVRDVSLPHQVLQLIDSGYRLPPPPGCPKAIYGLMMQCW